MCRCLRGQMCCDRGASILETLEKRYRGAVLTGDWDGFDDVREMWENHIRRAETGEDVCERCPSSGRMGGHEQDPHSR